ncbi:hypothetical protein CIFAM_14_01537 [Citrobacter farmeri GTC 1319]|nr:hypothetical protein CIFAM_14_01537 [Citrobacter farmeri GTC 1319]
MVAPSGTNPQAKANVLTRLEVATRRKRRVLFVRAARRVLYRDERQKAKHKCAHCQQYL